MSGESPDSPNEGLLRRIVAKLVSQPLFISQMFASAAGALGMVIAAAFMSQDHFTTFSLLILVSGACSGAVHSFLIQPALIEFRTDRGAHIHIRLALAGALCSALVFVGAAIALGVTDPVWLVVLGSASTLPVVADWLRLRAISLDLRWDVAAADGARLLVTLFAPALLLVEKAAEPFFLFICLTWTVTIVILVVRLPAVSAHLHFRRVLRPAASQFADYVVGQFTSTIPLLVLAGLGASELIGGVRIAQTLLGPLNMVFAASTVNLLADGATRESHADPKDLIRHSRKLAVRLSAGALILVTVVAAALWVTGFSLRGVDNTALTIGTLLVGALAVFSGFGGIDAIVLRLLGHHGLATVGRAVLVCLTGIGYVGGFALGGVDTSLVLGFVVAAIANPIAFVLPAHFVYRRHTRPQARGSGLTPT